MKHEGEPSSADAVQFQSPDKSQQHPFAHGEGQPAPAQPHAVEQTVFDRVLELEQQVQSLKAKLDRRQEQNREAVRRYRERNIDEVRRRNAERMREKRARERGQDGNL